MWPAISRLTLPKRARCDSKDHLLMIHMMAWRVGPVAKIDPVKWVIISDLWHKGSPP